VYAGGSSPADADADAAADAAGIAMTSSYLGGSNICTAQQPTLHITGNHTCSF